MSELQLIWLMLILSPVAAYLLAGLAGVAAGVPFHQAFLNYDFVSIFFGLVGIPILLLLSPFILLIAWGYGSANLARRKGYSFAFWGALCTAVPFLTLIPMSLQQRSSTTQSG